MLQYISFHNELVPKQVINVIWLDNILFSSDSKGKTPYT